MSSRSPIFIFDSAAQTPVEAVLLEGLTEDEVSSADSAWLPFLNKAVTEGLSQGMSLTDMPEHSHWDWTRKYRARSPQSQFFGIEFDGQMQGMMVVRTDKFCRLPEQKGLPLVYIDYLAAAPWNLSGLVVQPRYRGSGAALVATAIRYSIDLSWGGRIGLHSLVNAEDFYRSNFGMMDLGIDFAYEGLRYFETRTLAVMD